MRRARVLLLAAPLLAGCLAHTKPPPLQRISLAGKQADYRDYRTTDVCRSEPTWLVEQLRGMNRLLAAWSAQTDLSPAAAPSPEQRALIAEGTQRLPALLELYASTLERLRGCGRGLLNGLREAPGEGRRQVELARQRLIEAPRRLAAIDAEAVRARERWQAELPARRETARSTLCGLTTPPLTVYLGVEEPDRTRRWFFCDGAEVVRSPGLSPVFSHPPPPQPPPGNRRKRRAPVEPDASAYFEQAARYPEPDLDRSPR